MSGITSAAESYNRPVVDTVRANAGLVFGIASIVTIVCIVVAFVVTPVYRGTATLIASDDSSSSAAGLTSMLGDLGGLASIAGLNIGTDTTKVEAEALLQSRQFTESFISDNNLLPVLFPTRWDSARNQWHTSWIHPRPPTLYDGFQKFDQDIRTVTEDRKTGIVTVDVDWTDAAQGAQWVNELIRRVNSAMRQRAMSETEASIALLSTQLQSATGVDLQQAIARGLETSVKQRALASVRTDYAFRIIDPAKATGPDDYIRPKKVLYFVFGPLIGLMLGIGAALALDRIRSWFR